MVPLAPLFALYRIAPTSPHIEAAATVVERLKPSIGSRIEIEPSLGRLPILVDASGTTAQTTLSAVAFALHATVVQKEGALRIERTTADRKALRTAHVAVNRSRADAALIAWGQILKRSSAFGEVADQVKKARTSLAEAIRDNRTAAEEHRSFVVSPDLVGENMITPVGRLLHDILVRVGTTRIADRSPSEILFLSDHPNAVEAPLPLCTDLVEAYIRLQGVYAPDKAALPAKLVLSVDDTGATLDLYDSRGRKVDSGWMMYDMQPIVTGPVKPPPSLEPKWTDLDVAAQKTMRTLSPTNIRTETKDLPDEYLHPERFDPLDFVVRAGLLALSRTTWERPFVVVPSDGLLKIAAQCVRDNRLDFATFDFRLFGTEGGEERTTYGKTTVVRPTDELKTEVEFTDREVLGRSIRRIIEDRRIDLLNWSSIRLALYTGHSQPIAERYLLPLMRLGFPTFPGVQSHSDGEYALIGSVSQTRGLSPRGSDSPFDRLLEDGMEKGWLHFSGAVNSSDLDRAPSSILGEIQEANVTAIKRETTVAQRYRPADEDEVRRTPFRGQDAETLGTVAGGMLGLRPSGATDAWTREGLKAAFLDVRFRVGRRLTLGVDVLLRSGLHATVEAQDLVADQQGLGFSGLPPTFQRDALQAAERILESPRVAPSSNSIRPGEAIQP